MLGTRILGYLLEEQLGQGGMGTVYKGVNAELGQTVAIKVLDVELARKPEVRERFLQEARIQIALKHPGIVQVLTADTMSAQPALVMELVEGMSLADVLKRRGALPVAEAVAMMDKILDAVGYAHNHGVDAHRDLKPANIMVMANGTVKVLDWGIARVVGDAKLTRTGTQMGTADYMAPEQILGKAVDRRVDIYSLGCVLFEILTGRTPFAHVSGTTDSDFILKQAHVQTEAPDPRSLRSELPAAIVATIARALAKVPEQRFETAAAMKFALRSPVQQPVASDQRIAAPVPSSPLPAPPNGNKSIIETTSPSSIAARPTSTAWAFVVAALFSSIVIVPLVRVFGVGAEATTPEGPSSIAPEWAGLPLQRDGDAIWVVGKAGPSGSKEQLLEAAMDDAVLKLVGHVEREARGGTVGNVADPEVFKQRLRKKFEDTWAVRVSLERTEAFIQERADGFYGSFRFKAPALAVDETKAELAKTSSVAGMTVGAIRLTEAVALQADEALVVTDVGGIAASIGARVGDRIIRVGSDPVRTLQDFDDRLRKAFDRGAFIVVVNRDGGQSTLVWRKSVQDPRDAQLIPDRIDGDGVHVRKKRGLPPSLATPLANLNNRIEITDKVYFPLDSDRILPRSYELLDSIARSITEHTEISKIGIEGHSSRDENDSELSERRAKSVMRYLVDNGHVARERLNAKGYGASRPIAENNTEEGKATNRRVEFRIFDNVAESPR